MKTPSLGLMLLNAVSKAWSAPLSVIRPAAMILNAKQGFFVWRITEYMRAGSLWR
jgi:hypothetical protein